jgi:hypothetical protein
MKRIYLSGPISGLPLEEAQQNFAEAQSSLEGALPGVEIVNPMVANPHVEGKSWEQYMVEDLELLRGCDFICMLPGWEFSKGARLELEEAVRLDLSRCILDSKNNLKV